MIIEVHPYNTHWPEHFIEIEYWLSLHISSPYKSIEHVGSTSVPGLSAKPIIDIDIIIDEEKDKQAIIDELTALGYIHLGDLGIIGREAFRKSGRALEFPNHNLYIIPEANVAWHNHKFLRDYLRSNKDSVKTYSELKIALAQEFSEDIDAYLDGKTKFILEILKLSDIPKSSLKEIEKQNSIS